MLKFLNRIISKLFIPSNLNKIGASLVLYFVIFQWIRNVFTSYNLNKINFKSLTFDTIFQLIEYQFNQAFIPGGNPFILILPMIGGILLFEYFYQKIKSNKKRNVKEIKLTERLFVLLPYIWFGLDISFSMIDYCLQFYAQFTSELDAKNFFIDILAPIYRICKQLPGYDQGLLNVLSFSFCFQFVGRSLNGKNKRFKSFVRYHYINSILIINVHGLFHHLFTLWLKYSNDQEVNDFFGITIYSFFILSFLVNAILALLGTNSKFPFFHEAVLWHSGSDNEEETT